MAQRLAGPDNRTLFAKQKAFAVSRILDPAYDFSYGKIMPDREKRRGTHRELAGGGNLSRIAMAKRKL